MSFDMVRDPEVEERIIALLERDPTRLWNITKLKDALDCSRGKVERAVAVLDSQERVWLDNSTGTSWIVRLRQPSPANQNAPGEARGRGNSAGHEGKAT
jgi:hypothetical protein